MANEKNLKPIRSTSEAREKGQKGGKASGKSRREKRLLKDTMLDLLKMPVSDTDNWNMLSEMGIKPNKIDNRTLMVTSLFMRVVKRGDVAAFKEIRNLIGEDTPDEENGQLEKLLRGIMDG